MPSGSDRIIALRRLLEERHPTARSRTTRVIATGVPALDEILGGGLHSGTLTEWVSARASSGSQTSLGALLLHTRLARQRVALIDAAGAFDPEGLDDDAVAHLVWVRCAKLSECWRAADLAVRDPNYAVVAVDVRGQPLRALMRTRDSIWVRLQRAAEQAGTAVVVQSDSAIVPNAACRVEFIRSLEPGSLLAERSDIVHGLAPELQRMRVRRVEVSA